MRNSVISVLAAIAAVGVPALFAAPASAANGPPVVGCTSGSSCIVELNYQVTYSGSTGGNNGVVIPPPPCIGVPAGDAHTGSQAIVSLYGNTAPVPSPSTARPSTARPSTAPPSAGPGSTSPSPAVPAPSPSAPAATSSPPPDTLPPAEQQILSQAQQLVNSNPIAGGEWYQIAGDPYATAAAQQVCDTLPPYAWVPGNGPLRVSGLQIPERILATLAYNQLTTATLGTVTLNPKGNSDTNLPTFLDVVLNEPALGLLGVTTAGIPYVSATAEADGHFATVWAKVTGLTITPGTSDAMPWQAKRCDVAHLNPANAHQFILGSRYSKADMAQVGANQPIDCGVTYTAPGTYHLTVHVGWDACLTPGLPTAVGPPPGNACRPVPGVVGGLNDRTADITIRVREIQSVNG